MPSREKKNSPERHPTYQRIYDAVRSIPRGAVATYGQIAAIARASGPRQVGYALHNLPDGSGVPWYRVINAQGRVSPRSEPGSEGMQRVLLEAEGVVFDARGRVATDEFWWDGV